MPHATFDRIAAGGGVAFVILGLSLFANACTAPAVHACADAIRCYLR
jgi:hypothetical protein